MLTRQMADRIIDLITMNARFYSVVKIAYHHGTLTRFANSEIHQNVESTDCEVNIQLFDGEKMASVTTNVTTDEALLAALNQAELQMPVMPDTGTYYERLKDEEHLDIQGYNPLFDTMYSPLKRADEIVNFASKIERGFGFSGIFEIVHRVDVWGNSHDVSRFCSRSNATIEVMVTHETGASGMSTFTTIDPYNIDFNAVAQDAFKKAKEGIGCKTIALDKYDVILEPRATADIIDLSMYIGTSSKLHVDGISPYLDMLGKQVAFKGLSVYSPHNEKNLNCLPFDAQGYKKNYLDIIQEGMLKNIATDSITAPKLGLKNNGCAIGYDGDGGMVQGLVIQSGKTSQEEMIKSTKRGLLISRFHYMNIVDLKTGMLTGLTKDGLFLIENGKVTKPIKNLRFTDSILRMLNAIEYIGDDNTLFADCFGNISAPSMKIRAVAFTGQTDLDTDE